MLPAKGLNLQRAHLMVNYDLPWNPNRIEQRFGRIHRIGQTEVCRLWNLVAKNTREGEVFARLLEKIDEQRKPTAARCSTSSARPSPKQPLRDLLIDAIRYGEQPDVRAKMSRSSTPVSPKASRNSWTNARWPRSRGRRPGELRRQMDEAKARRLQPHYIQTAFTAAFQPARGTHRQTRKGPL